MDTTLGDYVNRMTVVELQTLSEAICKEAVDLNRRGERGRSRTMWSLHDIVEIRRIQLLSAEEAKRTHYEVPHV